MLGRQHPAELSLQGTATQQHVHYAGVCAGRGSHQRMGPSRSARSPQTLGCCLHQSSAGLSQTQSPAQQVKRSLDTSFKQAAHVSPAPSPCCRCCMHATAGH